MSRWTLIRVSESTVAELCRVRDSMLTAEELSLIDELPRDRRDRVGLETVILRLVAMRRRHAERRAAALARRRRRKLGITTEEQPDHANTATGGGDSPTP